MTRQRITLRSLRQRISRAHANRKDKQRRVHLSRLVRAMRHKLQRAYPHGYEPGRASLLLSDGDELVDALARFKAGTYGICEDCQNPIPLLELWAVPHRRHCRNCLVEHGSPPGRKMRFVL